MGRPMWAGSRCGIAPPWVRGVDQKADRRGPLLSGWGASFGIASPRKNSCVPSRASLGRWHRHISKSTSRSIPHGRRRAVKRNIEGAGKEAPASTDGIRGMATTHRVRCRRDGCRDYYIPERRGEIFQYGVDTIGVQIGGPATDGRNLGRRVVLVKKCRRVWDDPVQDGDGEAIFLLPESRLLEAAQVVKAYRKRQLSPEHAWAAAERLRRFRETKVLVPA